MNIILRIYHKFRKLILYGIIGGFCASLDFGIYTLLCYVLPYLNRQYNFKVTDKTFYRFRIFYLVGLSGLLVSEVLIYIFVNMMGINHLISKIITVFVSALLQFLLNKYITFKKLK